MHGQLIISGEKDSVINKYLEDTSVIAKQDLRSRTTRSGNQRLKFTELYIEDRNGNKVQELVSGNDYSIILSYMADGLVENVSVSIGIYGNYGQFLLMCNNEMAGQNFARLSPNGKVKCLLPRLPFSQGIYHINLYCEVKGVVSDWVQEAATLSVVDGDFYGTGKGSPSSHGGFLAHQTWSQIQG
jgi:lipopolysaccharide transport system ATP-binding protein